VDALRRFEGIVMEDDLPTKERLLEQEGKDPTARLGPGTILVGLITF
jgi:hypothetical protein